MCASRPTMRWCGRNKGYRWEFEAVQDSATHVSIMPRVTMLLEKYETALANTQNDWERVSQNGVGI
jgi:hypothetical protein